MEHVSTSKFVYPIFPRLPDHRPSLQWTESKAAKIDHMNTAKRFQLTDYMQEHCTRRPICCGWSHAKFVSTAHPFAYPYRPYCSHLETLPRISYHTGSLSRPLSSLTILIGLHLIPYHEFFASQVFSPSVWPIHSVKVLADMNEGSPPHR